MKKIIASILVSSMVVCFCAGFGCFAEGDSNVTVLEDSVNVETEEKPKAEEQSKLTKLKEWAKENKSKLGLLLLDYTIVGTFFNSIC